MTDYLQLWSGLWGAVFGGFVGGVFAIVILGITTALQKKDAAAALVQQKVDSKNQLVEQRNERRAAREIEAVGELVQLVTTLIHQPPQDLSFVPELVRRCDLLTLNSPQAVGSQWSVTQRGDQTGITRHPLAYALAIELGLRQLNLSVMEELKVFGEVPFPIRLFLAEPLGGTEKKVSISNTLHDQFRVATSEMLRWHSLDDDEKLATFAGPLNSARQRAAIYSARTELVRWKAGTDGAGADMLKWNDMVERDYRGLSKGSDKDLGDLLNRCNSESALRAVFVLEGPGFEKALFGRQRTSAPWRAARNARLTTIMQGQSWFSGQSGLHQLYAEPPRAGIHPS